MELTKLEIKNLKEYCKDFDINNIENGKGKEIDSILIISHGNRQKHDSGYPFIKCIGWNHKDKKYYNLGYHDHIMYNCRINIDSFGKNIFHVMNYDEKKKWVISEIFISCSSLMVGSYVEEDKKIIRVS